MLILQSINGSRNAQPFMNTIRQLEKDLSIISDTLEVSHFTDLLSGKSNLIVDFELHGLILSYSSFPFRNG